MLIETEAPAGHDVHSRCVRLRLVAETPEEEETLAKVAAGVENSPAVRRQFVVEEVELFPLDPRRRETCSDVYHFGTRGGYCPTCGGNWKHHSGGPHANA